MIFKLFDSLSQVRNRSKNAFCSVVGDSFDLIKLCFCSLDDSLGQLLLVSCLLLQ